MSLGSDLCHLLMFFWHWSHSQLAILKKEKRVLYLAKLEAENFKMINTFRNDSKIATGSKFCFSNRKCKQSGNRVPFPTNGIRTANPNRFHDPMRRRYKKILLQRTLWYFMKRRLRSVYGFNSTNSFYLSCKD